MNIQPVQTPAGTNAPAAAELRQSPPQRAQEAAATVSGTTTAPAATRQPDTVSETQVQDAVKRVEAFVATKTSEISFSVDDDSGIRVVKVTDKSTNEVIRQIPSEEVVAIAQALDKLQGLFLRDKV